MHTKKPIQVAKILKTFLEEVEADKSGEKPKDKTSNIYGSYPQLQIGTAIIKAMDGFYNTDHEEISLEELDPAFLLPLSKFIESLIPDIGYSSRGTGHNDSAIVSALRVHLKAIKQAMRDHEEYAAGQSV